MVVEGQNSEEEPLLLEEQKLADRKPNRSPAFYEVEGDEDSEGFDFKER